MIINYFCSYMFTSSFKESENTITTPDKLSSNINMVGIP